jgi:hypothetical protein
MSASVGQGGTVPLFAIPFAAVNTGADPDFNLRLVKLCESQGHDPLHFRGRNDLLESPDATSGELRKLLLGQSSSVVAGLSDLSAANFDKLQVQARGWCSVVQRSGHIPSQHFTGASWLAVYCAQAGESDEGIKSAGVLRLYERRLGSIFRDASTSDLKSPWRYGNHTWKPVPGCMALFPAHVPHEVSVVRSDTPLILVFAMIRFVDRG